MTSDAMGGRDSLLVVKIGGGAGLDLAATCDDLARIAATRPLLVAHGVSDAMNRLCQELGVQPQSLTSPSGHSSRYTPPAVRDIYVRAANAVNQDIVAALRGRGTAAVGVAGDSVALHAERKRAIRAVVRGRVRMVRDDHSGSIRGVDADKLNALLDADETPVLPPMANSADGLLNVDGDRAAAAVAAALSAGTLLILSNVRGLYRDFPDETTFARVVPASDIELALEWAQGRMKRKIIAAREALDGGVESVIIADGRVSQPVQRALDGEGTRISA